MKLRITKPFRIAEDGINATEFQAGELVEVSERCAVVALRNNWAVKADSPAVENKALEPADENKKPRTRAKKAS